MRPLMCNKFLDRKPNLRQNVTTQSVRPVCDTLFPEPLLGKPLYSGPER